MRRRLPMGILEGQEYGQETVPPGAAAVPASLDAACQASNAHDDQRCRDDGAAAGEEGRPELDGLDRHRHGPRPRTGGQGGEAPEPAFAQQGGVSGGREDRQQGGEACGPPRNAACACTGGLVGRGQRSEVGRWGHCGCTEGATVGHAGAEFASSTSGRRPGCRSRPLEGKPIRGGAAVAKAPSALPRRVCACRRRSS